MGRGAPGNIAGKGRFTRVLLLGEANAKGLMARSREQKKRREEKQGLRASHGRVRREIAIGIGLDCRDGVSGY